MHAPPGQPHPGQPAPGDAPDRLYAPLASIEDALTRLCAGEPDAPPALRDAMRYAVLSGGKRLRPLLCWHAFVACAGREPSAGAELENLRRACAAIEMVHAFSLAHDDLPALDNDDMRRGRPTLHKHAGEGLAILAGDALLSHAFCVLGDLSTPRRAEAMRTLADAAWRMVRGQVLDTIPDTTISPQDAVHAIHAQKTGALILAACRLGALCAAGASDSPEAAVAEHAVTRYARAVGLMFQIVDDLLDVEQASAHAGKATGKDAAAGKRTFPGVFGAEESRRRVEALRQEAWDALEPLGAPAENLRLMANALAHRTK
ncbi:MAG: polyprenyl synthetase family protein [Planctomycetota bacterium]|nr:polyprenyl synthetase family protein [Planctomycetota bacterium]